MGAEKAGFDWFYCTLGCPSAVPLWALRLCFTLCLSVRTFNFGEQQTKTKSTRMMEDGEKDHLSQLGQTSQISQRVPSTSMDLLFVEPALCSSVPSSRGDSVSRILLSTSISLSDR